MADAKAIVDKLYRAFNDPGFLGLGGTDEEGALEALRMAKDQGIMRDVDALYAKTYPTELNLKDEIDDELSGDDFDQAMAYYDEGMKAESKDRTAAADGGGAGAGGGTGRTQEPRLRVSGTLAPNPNIVEFCLMDFDMAPSANAKCRLAGNPYKLYACDGNGKVSLPVPYGSESVDIEWTDGNGIFGFQQTVFLDVEGRDDETVSKQLSNLGFIGKDLSTQLGDFQEAIGGDEGAARTALNDWADSGSSPFGGAGKSAVA